MLTIGDAQAQSRDDDALDSRRDGDAAEIEIDDDGEVEVDDEGDTDVSGLVLDILRRVGSGRHSARHSRHKMRHARRHGNVAPQAVTPASREEIAPQPVDAEESDDVLVPPLPLPEDAEGAATPLPPEGLDPAVVAPAAPLSYRDRLLARRLALIDRMRASAADPAQQQQLDYLEGMVFELHDQGLMTFAQRFIGSLQEGDSAAASEIPPVDVPELDLGESSPLPLDDGEAPPELPPPAPENE
ncbi:MAG: hypothetical protein DWQ34_11660 [Planctomycetota bacterium]|nr:MAG: hypothetical protein DWQ34_11660 [Planctomycetota bacterium]REK30107.1 MAG: hypothetical protein DWQ41_02965 [Planctomycetota bacterium]REK37651.1 MAG: hypothetical protein DWQ45_06560 [Planctomycetota bacterium]